MGQAPTDESSLLFSLKELERLEEARVTKDRDDAAARREAEHRAVLERARLAADEETRRLSEHEDRLRAAEARRTEAAARVAAVSRAVADEARQESEARDRTRLQESHELELERTRSRASLRTHRFLIGASLAATLAATGFAAAVTSEMRDRERFEAQSAAVEAAERAQHERTLAALHDAQARAAELSEQVRGLQREVESNREPSAGLPTGRPGELATRTPPPPLRNPKAYPTVSPRTTRPCTLDGDPLNGCLPTR